MLFRSKASSASRGLSSCDKRLIYAFRNLLHEAAIEGTQVLRNGKHGAIAVNGALYEYTNHGLSEFAGEIAVNVP